MITRPHLLAIRHECAADREAFVHFWAVMGHMLGVQDRYNMCLLPLDSVIVVCQAMIRYIFLPLIQLETPEFRRMVNALCIGLSHVIPHMTYDIQMFTVKRVLGVPGYQYAVDLSKEKMCPPLFTQKEAADLRDQIFKHTGVEYREFIFSTSVPIVRHRFRDNDNTKEMYDSNDNELPTHNNSVLEVCNYNDLEITVADPDDEGWQHHLNDSRFYSLSQHDQYVIRARIYVLRLCEYRVFRYLFEVGASLALYWMRRRYSSVQAVTDALQSG